MRLCNRGIGVYSPHTSVDGAVGGVNDWLASVVMQGTPAEVSTIVPCKPGVEGTASIYTTHGRSRRRRLWTNSSSDI